MVAAVVKLNDMFLLALFGLLLSFVLLAIICDEFFVPALEVIAEKWQLPEDVAGATLMAIGSSAPELCIAFIALVQGSSHGEVGAGTIVGSAIFNILVIIGASATFRVAKLTWQPVLRDLLFYSLSIGLLLYSFRDGLVTLSESISFVGLYLIYLGIVAVWKRWFPRNDADPIDIVQAEGKPIERKNKVVAHLRGLLGLIIPDAAKRPRTAWVAFGLSISIIAILSYVMVESAVVAAEILGIPAALIALTIVAAGTSIPDLLSSMAVAKRGRGDMAISNAVGSNIFDILIGLGLPWLVVLTVQSIQQLFSPQELPGVASHLPIIAVSTENLLASIFLLFATVVTVFSLLFVRKWSIGPKVGWFLIALYFAYLGYNVALLFA